MSATFDTVQDGIAAIVSADTDLNESGQVFQYEPDIDDVKKDPWASVVASDNESEFETTTDNKRIYGFVVRIFVERRNRGPQAAEELMTSIVDRLVQAFDENYDLDVSGVIFTRAAPSSWAYVLAEREYRMAEIRLSTIVSVDVKP